MLTLQPGKGEKIDFSQYPSHDGLGRMTQQLDLKWKKWPKGLGTGHIGLTIDAIAPQWGASKGLLSTTAVRQSTIRGSSSATRTLICDPTPFSGSRLVVTDGTQFRYGGRVPCLVLSPHAKAGFISHARHSHVSVVRFCENTFGLPSLNARTTADDGMADCFDFKQAPLPPPA